MTQDLMRFIAEKLDEGEKVALVTLVEKAGSAPGAEGQMMAVLVDGSSRGTVGGGITEKSLINRSVEAIKNEERTLHFSADLAENGLLCGGKIDCLVNVLGLGERLVIFGAGHVAQSLAPLGESIGFQVIVCDDRPEFSEAFGKMVHYVTCEENEWAERLVLEKDDFVVICTRGHRHDLQALRYCLGKPLRYLSMIGSKNKVSSLYKELLAEHVSKEELEAVYAPVGIDIADGRPCEIAVSVMAEILCVKNKGRLQHMKLDKIPLLEDGEKQL